MTAVTPVDQGGIDLDARLVLAGTVLAEARRSYDRSPNGDRAAALVEARADIDTLLDLRLKLQPRRPVD